MRKALAAVLITASLAVILSSFHYHSDGLMHDDCLTCITASHTHSINTDTASVTRSNPVVVIIPQISLSLFLKEGVSNLTIRSPPL